MTCIGTWSVESSSSGENITQPSEESGILAVKDQEGFGQCLEYRRKGTVLQISTNGVRCQESTSQNVNLSFQGSCQGALVDLHAIAGCSHENFGNVLYLMLSVMLICLAN